MSHDEPLNRLQVFQTPSKICAGNVDCQHLSTTSVCRKIIFPRLFLGIETPENFETETAPSFLDSLHLEEAESNTFESDAAWKYPQAAQSHCLSRMHALVTSPWNFKTLSNDHLFLALQRFTFFKLQTMRWNAIVYQAWYSSVVVFYRNVLLSWKVARRRLVFLRSDGQPVACKNLMDTAAFRQHFFFDARCDGQAVSFAALMQHAAQGGRNFLHPRFCRNFHTVFLRSDGQAVACKNLMDTAAFRQHFFFDARCDGQAVSCSSNATLHPRRQEFLTSKFLQEFPHRVSQKWWSSCCLQKSDGHCSIPPTLFFWCQVWWSSCFFCGSNSPPKEAGISYIQVSAGISTPCFSEVMVKLLPAKIWWTLQHSANTCFFDARCDGQAVSCGSNATRHPRRQEFLTSSFCRNFHTVFLRSDGQAVACKNLMDTAAFRQHFFFDARCDGQAVSFAALILHPRRQEFLTSRFLQEFPHRVSQKWWSSCCLQKSDGNCSIPPTLFFLMPGVIASGILRL